MAYPKHKCLIDEGLTSRSSPFRRMGGLMTPIVQQGGDGCKEEDKQGS